MIPMALDRLHSVRGLSFDLSRRTLQVLYNGIMETPGPITDTLPSLALAASLRTYVRLIPPVAVPCPICSQRISVLKSMRRPSLNLDVQSAAWVDNSWAPK